MRIAEKFPLLPLALGGRIHGLAGGLVEVGGAESYDANSGRAEQGVWFGELRALLAADPEWFNGTLAREAMA